eukprot:TRINITY_DN72359_c0_g1_i1.p1 TRINITY_DN72359_c0_g1~~TRINITY_DN72359_c0_g1_i1.p1  ORF type:complete len:266 (-),score=63.35 TRINITY_DN72359_c0_g1_i1:12-782(-)
MKLHTVGFCGVDDSVNLQKLEELDAQHAGWLEWGVLLRPDRQGQPRYASMEVLRQLGALARGDGRRLRIAAHLCGQDCLRALQGDVARLQELHELIGFKRLQLNPTCANDASGWEPASAAEGIRAAAAALPDVEFILQLNQETEALFSLLFRDGSLAPPSNLAVLLDASCGLGVAPKAWATPPQDVASVGFAGGLGPDTILEQLEGIAAACGDERHVWVDMESGIRSKQPEGKDIFDLDRGCRVAELVRSSGRLLQ